MYRGTAVGQIVQYVQGYRCGSNRIVQSVQGVVLKTNSIEQSVGIPTGFFPRDKYYLKQHTWQNSLFHKKSSSVCSWGGIRSVLYVQGALLKTNRIEQSVQGVFLKTNSSVCSVPQKKQFVLFRGGVFGLFCTYREKSLLKKSSYHSSVRSVLYVQGQGYCRIHDYLSILSGAITLTYYLGRVCLCVCASSSTSKRKFNGKNLSKACCAMIKSSPLASSLSVYEEILVSFEV